MRAKDVQARVPAVTSYRGKKAKRSDEGAPPPPLPARTTSSFKLKSPYKPAGDQPQAIRELVEGLRRGDEAQVLLGITGSGKTYSVANVIAEMTFAIVNVLPEPVMPSSTCALSPRCTPSTSSSIALG